jgi:raffinose/stachyose/melibiose transport system substrate-binding protein
MIQHSQKPRWKKAAVGAAVTLASAIALTGCSSGSPSSHSTYNPKAPVTLTLTNETATGNTTPIEPIIKDYEKLHPNVKINVSLVPVANYAQVVGTQFQSGAGPDLFWATTGDGDNSSILKFAEGGYVLPMNRYPWAVKSVPSNAKDLFYTKGTQYGLPIDMVPVGDIYNLTALAKDGITNPPTSLAEVYADCTKVASKGATLFNLAAAAAPNAGVFVMSIAASYAYSQDPTFNAEKAAGKATFATSAGWKKTLQIILDLQSEGCFQAGVASGQIPALFTAVGSGSSLSLSAPAGATADLAGIDKSNTYKVAPFPGVAAATTRLFDSPSDALGVNAHSKHVDAALAFAEYMSEPKIADIYAGYTGNASMTTVTTKEFPASFSYVAPILKNQSKFYPLADLSWPNPTVYSALTAGVQGLLTGQATVDQVLANMDSAWGPTK